MVRIKAPNGNFLTALQVLNARCPLCENPLNWSKNTQKDVFYATCCGFIFRAGICDSRNHIFHVTFCEADISNVVFLTHVPRGGESA